MSKKKEWTAAFGEKLAVFSRIYAFLVSTWNRMGIGPEIIDWITTDKGVDAFRKAIESFGADFLEATASVVEPKQVIFVDFPIWMTIKRNPERKTGDDYRKASQVKGYQIGNIADMIIDRILEMQREEEYDLYLISPRILGFIQDTVTQEEFYTAVLKAGFELAPLWIGPELREKYWGQPMGECLPIGIDPVEVNGGLFVFGVDCYGGARWLSASGGGPGSGWGAGRKWVFVRRR